MSAPAESRPIVTALAPALVATALCALLTPVVVNGDGLGYLKAAPSGVLYPGHLGYLPLLRLLGRLAGAGDPVSLLGPARGLSIVGAALAAGAVALAGRRLISPRGGLLAGLGLAVSFGVVQAGSDVETYAPALAAMAVATLCAVRRATGGGIGWVIATAFAVAAAALLHIENALFAPAAALLCARGEAGPPSRRWRRFDLGLVIGGSGAGVVIAYLAALAARGEAPATALGWLLGAHHGYRHPITAETLPVALYGMAKALVWAPYPSQATWLRVSGQTALGGLALAALLWLARRPGRTPVLGRAVAWAWLLPYTLVGVAFFGSDNERWLFLLPPSWLVAAAGMETSRRGRRLGAGLVASLLLCDLGFGLPLSRDGSLRQRADAAVGVVRAGDLLISPGHSWDEYVGFYQSMALDRFPMIYFCGLLGGAAPMRAELGRRVLDARARGAQIFFARGDEAVGADGWKEIARFGITPDTVDRYLPPGGRVAVAPGMVRIDLR